MSFNSKTNAFTIDVESRDTARKTPGEDGNRGEQTTIYEKLQESGKDKEFPYRI